MTSTTRRPATTLATSPAAIGSLVERIREPLRVGRERKTGRIGIASGEDDPATADDETVGFLPPLYPEWLGDRSFLAAHSVRFPYVAGEMANGIATVEMVTATARAGMLGLFGAAGLEYAQVAGAVSRLREELPDSRNWGVNLIHTPGEPAAEEAVAELLARGRVPTISASAFMDLTPAVVRCAVSGLSTLSDGRISRRSQLLAKVSRVEVAQKFLAPAPGAILDVLLRRGDITEQEARLALHVPLAGDVTVESDSGGHTDNRPLGATLPAIVGLRDSLTRKLGITQPARIGAAGGLGTPAAVASAFALGAAYVVTGSINQVARESGLSDAAKALLAEADLSDVTMAPAADMFELGIKLQVLRRGTLFPARATLLYELYTTYPSLEAVPEATRARLERDVFQAPVKEIWRLTRDFWQRRDPGQVERAESDGRHRMALVFRWYLGNSSRWAIQGTDSRRWDYQIWCGPAMGAFNRWTAEGFLAEPENRTVVQIALNLLEGAAVTSRAQQVRTFGVPVPPDVFSFVPRQLV